MSTVVYKNGFRIYVNPKESEHKGRPHCHVAKGDAKASIDLLTCEVLMSNGGFSRGDMRAIVEAIGVFREVLLDKWEEYHGKKEE